MLRRTRNTFQHGWIERKQTSRGDVFVYRWRERLPDRGYRKRALELGPVMDFKTQANAWKEVEQRKLAVNPDDPKAQITTFGSLLERYVAEELPHLRHSTSQSYKCYIENHIKPRWGLYPIAAVKPYAVERWLESMDLAGKSKGQIHNVMRVTFNCAMRWELIKIGENPMRLVRVRGVSKRQTEPRVLTVDECRRLVEEIPEEPFRTMVILDMATGLRCSELLALQWSDFNWESLTLMVRRAIVDGVVDVVKTRYSQAGLPLDPTLAEMAWSWKTRTPFSKPEDWVFASPFQGGRMPYRPWGVQQRRIKPAARNAALGDIGWHTFRHTFSSLLRANGEDLKVQQELLRHADIRTTMNVYTQAMTEQKRQAHTKIVRLVLNTKPYCPLVPSRPSAK
jgi:integrase